MKRTLTVIASLAITFFASEAMACTTAVISARASATGRPMLFKQRDSGCKFNYVDHFSATDSTFAFTAVVNTYEEAGEGVWSGANTEGFAIMNSMSYGLSPLVSSDRPWEGVIMKRALEICRTVDDFEAYIRSLPQPNGLEANFGVIDAYGGASYFEVHDYGFTRFDAQDSECGYLIRSNYSMTGREGEGKGIDRYDIAFAKMGAHEGLFTAEWIIDELGRNPVISRKTTVSTSVIEGVGPMDPRASSVLWVVPGYTPAAYAIPAWVAAGNRIASPLKTGEKGSAMNELARKLLLKYFMPHFKDDPDGSARCHFENGRCRKIISRVRSAEAVEFAVGRKLDSLVRSGRAVSEDFDAFNSRAASDYEKFSVTLHN